MEEHVQQRRYVRGLRFADREAMLLPAFPHYSGDPLRQTRREWPDEMPERELPTPPELHSQPLLLRISTHGAAVGEFAQAAFFPFLFSLRVPSETPTLRRAFPSGLLGDF